METLVNYLQHHWIELVGAVLGILYLYYEYRAHMLVWPVGILVPLFYSVVYWDSHLYALMAINFYYIVVCIYGWIHWYSTKGESNSQLDQVKTIPFQYWLYIIVSVAIIAYLIYYTLNHFDGHYNALESIISALSVVATWMLTKKWVELWILLGIANILSLYLYMDIDLWATFVLHIVYLIGSILGYFNWRKSIKHAAKK